MTIHHSILNISGYKFILLNNISELQTAFKEKAAALGLKGTILLSGEGINIFMAGTPDSINAFRGYLEEDERFLNIPWKDSWSATIPYKRLLIKIKKEIISMNAPMICQNQQRAKTVAPKELKAWLDNQDEQVIMLDTRNDYEYRLGSFHNAVKLDLDHFREFPEKIKSLLSELKSKKIVTFCTGGIRCEKAALYMDQLGFESVYQLDGGILKYFEECEGAHYDGDCFVFDKRVALDNHLKETEAVMCFACLNPLTIEEQQSPLYIRGEQCPYCVGKKAAKQSHDIFFSEI